MTTRSQLEKAARDGQLVQFSRRFEDSEVRGYVLDVGPSFFLLLLLSDRVWFDGFECFRIQDVRTLKADPHSNFVEAALKKRGERKPKTPKIGLASIEDILVAANRDFPLVTIHCERRDPDICYIGRVIGIEEGRVSLLEIDPGAVWERTPNQYRLSDITRVGFGADYEDALAVVGQQPSKKGNNRRQRTPR